MSIGRLNDVVAINETDIYVTSWLPHPDDPYRGSIDTAKSIFGYLDEMVILLGLKWGLIETNLYHCKVP
jgi:hypothetical protein